MKRFLITFSISIALIQVSNLSAQSLRLMGYFNSPGWENNVQYTKLTDIIFCFLNPNNSGNLQYSGSFNQASFNLILSNAHNNGVKVFISSGGAGSGSVFSTVCADPVARKEYVNEIISFIHTNDIEGFDLDWEFPSTTTDKDNHQALLDEMRQALDSLYTLTGKKRELSIAVGGELGHTNYVNPASLLDVDLLNVMAYDAPASAGPNHSSLTFAKSAVNIWNGTMGVPFNKIMLGVPFYGRPTAGNSSYLTYNSLSASDPATAYNSDYFDNVYYNGAPTLQSKATYAQNNSLAGIMIWQLSQDRTDQYSLLSALYEITAQGTIVPGMTVDISNPVDNQSFVSGSYVTIDVNASYNNGSIKKVEFYNGNVKIGEDTIAPYSYTWKNISSGNYPLKAIATNNLDESKNSLLVNITVASPCSVAAWLPSAVYTTGMQASYKNSIYQAKWWTQNNKPDSIMSANPWALIGPCGGNAPNGVPPTPTTLSATESGQLNVDLRWNRNTSDASYYVIKRSTVSGGPYSIIDTIGGNDSLYTDQSISVVASYYYLVYGVNSSGPSTNSNEASVMLTLSGVKNMAELNAFSIYPNPSNGSFVVDVSNIEEGDIQILNVTGKLVKTFPMTGNKTFIESHLDSGIYFVGISNNGAVNAMRKLVIP